MHEDFHHNLLASMLETPPPSVGKYILILTVINSSIWLQQNVHTVNIYGLCGLPYMLYRQYMKIKCTYDTCCIPGVPDRPMHLDTEIVEVEEVRTRRPRQRPVLKTPSCQLMPARVPLEHNTSTADAALFFSRGFRPSWGPRSTLLIPNEYSVDLVTPYKQSPVFSVS